MKSFLKIGLVMSILFTAHVSALEPDSNNKSLNHETSQKSKAIRAKMILSRATDSAPVSTRMGYYDKRTGKVGIIDDPNLVFSINQPRNNQDEIIFECGQYQVCCVDWQESGCSDFILECAEIGCNPTPHGGGQFGTCDCSPPPRP